MRQVVPPQETLGAASTGRVRQETPLLLSVLRLPGKEKVKREGASDQPTRSDGR